MSDIFAWACCESPTLTTIQKGMSQLEDSSMGLWVFLRMPESRVGSNENSRQTNIWRIFPFVDAYDQETF